MVYGHPWLAEKQGKLLNTQGAINHGLEDDKKDQQFR